MKEKIRNIILNSVSDLNQTLDHKVLIEDGKDAFLFGNGGVLDSLALVSLIVAVEQGVETELNASIILASDKAMSQRRSPFASINTLVDYTESLIKEELAHA